MAFDAFLKLDGIPGESKERGHENEIELLSFSWGLSQVTTDGTGGGAGKVNVQDLSLSKFIDKASPALMLACASGEHIKKAVLTVRKSGDSQNDFLKVTLEDILISSFVQGGHAGGADLEPGESTSFHFQKITMAYRGQRSDGTASAEATLTSE